MPLTDISINHQDRYRSPLIFSASIATFSFWTISLGAILRGNRLLGYEEMRNQLSSQPSLLPCNNKPSARLSRHIPCWFRPTFDELTLLQSSRQHTIFSTLLSKVNTNKIFGLWKGGISPNFWLTLLPCNNPPLPHSRIHIICLTQANGQWKMRAWMVYSTAV